MMRIGIFSILFVFSMVACKREKTPVQQDTPHVNSMNVHVKFNGSTFSMDSIYTFSDGTKIQFSTLKFYLNQVNSGSTLLADYALYDWSVHPTKLFSKVGDLPQSDLLTFNVGVPSLDNHSDPSTWPSNHPLNIMLANDMHWDWNPGYIFIKIEAKTDTLVDANVVLNHNLTYHVGMDANFLSKNFSGVSWQTSGKASVLNLALDLDEVFTNTSQPVDVTSEHTTHSASGQEALTSKVLHNFGAALKLE